jgi:acetylglutamate kinase
VSRVVLKLGGRIAASAGVQARALHADGNELVVVHGAGPQITAEMERRGIPVRFVDGRRVTTAAGLNVVRESLLAVNEEVCRAIGPSALPLHGNAIGLDAVQLPDLGLVGEPVPCAPLPVLEALAAGRIPVVLPLAAGPLNVNADEAAAALAVGLDADRILFASDVPGVVVDGSVAAELPVARAAGLLREGAFEGGIVPKLLAAIGSARHGIEAEIGVTAVTTT